MDLTKEKNMATDFISIAVRIQDASNIVAVTGELREAMIHARNVGNDPRKDVAVRAIFFKLYDMMGALTEREMCDALLVCEKLVKEG